MMGNKKACSCKNAYLQSLKLNVAKKYLNPIDNRAMSGRPCLGVSGHEVYAVAVNLVIYDRYFHQKKLINMTNNFFY